MLKGLHRLELVRVNKRRVSRPAWLDDPKEIPAYSVAEVARSLRVSTSALIDWTKPHEHNGRKKEVFGPLIQLPDEVDGEGRMSFYNVVSAHVLLAARRQHKLSILDIRRALSWVKKSYSSRHPLVEYSFHTKGRHLFLKSLFEGEGDGATTDATAKGQQIFSAVLDQYLERIRRDESGQAFRLFPIAPGAPHSSAPVMMDPSYASGKLVVAETGVRASVLYERFHIARHSLDKLCRDFRLSPDQVKGAIDYLETAA